MNLWIVTFGGAAKINLGFVVVDMQNGFVAKNGSYDKLGMNTPAYREIIPKVPKSEEERLKIPIYVRGTWDAQTINELKPNEDEGDHIIIKRRDSAFQDTELRVRLQSAGINVLINMCGNLH